MNFLTAEHIGAVVAVIAVAIALSVTARRRPGAWIKIVAPTLAILIVAAQASQWVEEAVRGSWTPRYGLPFDLSDAAAFASAAALWWRAPLLVELTYFWGFGAIIQALATPDIHDHFPSYSYFRFYVAHGGVLVAACLLVAGLGLMPRPGAPRRVFLLTIAFTAVAGLVNFFTDGNYMFLRFKPASGSLMNFMGPWPWYIGSGAALALVFLSVLNAPFWIARRRAGERRR